MATSLTGPFLTDIAFSAAPVPRPPHPIKATWIVLSSAACTNGRAVPARAEAAAMRPASLRNSRREVFMGVLSLICNVDLQSLWALRARPEQGHIRARMFDYQDLELSATTL